MGGTTGLVGGLYVGGSTAPATGGVSIPVAVGIGVGVGMTTGYAGGAVSGVFDYYEKLDAAKAKVDYYKGKLAEAKAKYEKCLNPPTVYTYTDSDGYVWVFSEENYDSVSDAYTAYMNFIKERKAYGYQ